MKSLSLVFRSLIDKGVYYLNVSHTIKFDVSICVQFKLATVFRKQDFLAKLITCLAS